MTNGWKHSWSVKTNTQTIFIINSDLAISWSARVAKGYTKRRIGSEPVQKLSNS